MKRTINPIKICFTIPGNPLTKKNHQEIRKNFRTGKYFIAQNSAYENYEAMCIWQLKPVRSLIEKASLNPPYNIKYIYYRKTKQSCDLTNLEEATDDILVRAGIIEDDNYKIIASHDGSRVKFDNVNPRVEVEITHAAE